MSGGVDSAVSALLLRELGLDVVGVFMKNWDEEEDGVCAATRDYDDVRRTCDTIGIPYYTVNFAKEYYDRVFAHCLREFEAGRTPNPDVLCNREIKFDAFLKFAEGIGAEKIATGHFVRTDDGGRLLKGTDANKDQSYFLYMLKSEQLRRAVFPVGGMTKREVREIARRANLPVSEKKDSTGICFIGERRFKPFLQKYFNAEKGDIVTPDGTIIGRHDGLMYYTIGQRRGLGVGGKGGGEGRRFVVAKDTRNNRLIVEQNERSELLYSSEVKLTDITWIAREPPAHSFRCAAKFRYRQPDQVVTVTLTETGATVRACEPQRAVTPGQSAVLYDGEVCLGGGIVSDS
jgi:tRNA-specific 2-thiouridylase